MISLETARKLKDAGLEWEPKACDAYYWPSGVGDHPVLVMHNDFDLLKKEQKTKGIVWAPRLEQLLSEIERRGWDWELEHSWVGITGVITKVDKDGYQRESSERCGFNGRSPEQAAAKALLWILRRERDAH